jgi:hypothetical protein
MTAVGNCREAVDNRREAVDNLPTVVRAVAQSSARSFAKQRLLGTALRTLPQRCREGGGLAEVACAASLRRLVFDSAAVLGAAGRQAHRRHNLVRERLALGIP